MPSAIALALFAYAEGALTGKAGEGLLHGLKLVAIAIVAQAVLGMARNLAPDKPRAAIAAFALVLTAFWQGSFAQIGSILAGGFAGLALCRAEAPRPADSGEQAAISRRAGLACLARISHSMLADWPSLRAMALWPGLDRQKGVLARIAGVRGQPLGSAAYLELCGLCAVWFVSAPPRRAGRGRS